MLMRVGAAWMMMDAGIRQRRACDNPLGPHCDRLGTAGIRTRNSIALLRLLHSPATARNRLSGQRAELTRTRGCSS